MFRFISIEETSTPQEPETPVLEFLAKDVVSELMGIVTWIGINDLLHDWSGEEGIERQLTQLFELQELIYDSGARNFVFMNVPPFERAPCCTIPPSPFPTSVFYCHGHASIPSDLIFLNFYFAYIKSPTSPVFSHLTHLLISKYPKLSILHNPTSLPIH